MVIPCGRWDEVLREALCRLRGGRASFGEALTVMAALFRPSMYLPDSVDA